MSRYRCIVTRDVTESTIVTVCTPGGPEEANQKALEAVNADHRGKFKWEPDDAMPGEPYSGDPFHAELLGEINEVR